jgi:WD40 repeat protein
MKTVTAAAYTSDGANIVTASDDGTVRVWARDGVGTWAETSRLPVDVQSYGVWDVAFTANGTRIVAARRDGTAQVWIANAKGTWSEASPLEGLDSFVFSRASSPDRTRVLTHVFTDFGTRVWAAGTDGAWIEIGQLRDKKRGHPTSRGHVEALYSPDGTQVLTAASQDLTLRVWDVTWLASGHVRATKGLAPLVAAVCAEKLTGGLSLITRGDANAVPLLRNHVREDVCQPQSFSQEVLETFSLLLDRR